MKAFETKKKLQPTFDALIALFIPRAVFPSTCAAQTVLILSLK